MNFCVIQCSRATALLLRANETNCVSASSAVGGKQGENKVDVDDEIHPDAGSLLKPRCTERRESHGRVARLRASSLLFVSHAELLREILGNGRKTNDIADENLTALHVLASRANLNEERLSEENVLPLVKLLVLEYKATSAAANAEAGNDANSHRRSERMSKDIEDFLWSSRGGRERTVL